MINYFLKDNFLFITPPSTRSSPPHPPQVAMAIKKQIKAVGDDNIAFQEIDANKVHYKRNGCREERCYIKLIFIPLS